MVEKPGKRRSAKNRQSPACRHPRAKGDRTVDRGGADGRERCGAARPSAGSHVRFNASSNVASALRGSARVVRLARKNMPDWHGVGKAFESEGKGAG